MWIARDKDNSLHVWKLKPHRDILSGTTSKGDKIYVEFWGETNDGYNGDIPFYPSDYFEIDPSLFPELKWEDEPLEVDISIKLSKKELDKLVKQENKFGTGGYMWDGFNIGFKAGFYKAKGL